MNQTIEQYIPMAEMLAKTFGDSCEVVLHDLSTPQNSVVFAVNGHVTGRKVGQSFDHLIRHVLLSQDFANDYVANYYFQTEDGRMIKSSTVLLRNTDGKVAGALCINMDTTVLTAMSTLLAGLLPKPAANENWFERKDTEPSLKEEKEPQEETAHILEIAEDIIEQILGTHDMDTMKRDEKIAVIRFMDQKGLFLIKGTVERVAKRMGISKVTVYSYLDEIKMEKN